MDFAIVNGEPVTLSSSTPTGARVSENFFFDDDGYLVHHAEWWAVTQQRWVARHMLTIQDIAGMPEAERRGAGF